MSIKVKLVKEITKVDNKKLILPNSVSVFEGNIIITDSGNNRVCVLNDNQSYSIGGKFGLSKYQFKEPVYSTMTDEFIIVCDWHNNRIVLYKEKYFFKQIGIFGKLNSSKITNLLRLVNSFKSNGSFNYSHFVTPGTDEKKKPSLVHFHNLIKGLLYYLINPNILIDNLHKQVYLSKPNGCILINDSLFFTQKNNYCITKYDVNNFKVVKQIDNTEKEINFGRLGQITQFENNIYACDETNNKIWIFDTDLQLIDSITATDYNIFSIAINSKYIVTCGTTSFSLFDRNNNLIFEKNGDGEYHGVCIDDEYFYIANRLKHRVEKYKIEENKS